MNSGEYTEKLDVAEVYLKGNLYKRARRVYRNLLDKNHEDEELYSWTILRFIEACDAVAKTTDVKHWLEILGDRLLMQSNFNDEDSKLYLGISFYAWKHGYLDMAIKLGDILRNNLESADDEFRLKVWCNQLYFVLEQILLADIRSDSDSLPFLNKLLELSHLESQILSVATDQSKLKTNHKDTLGWYYFNLGKAYFSIDKNKALEYTERSSELFDDLLGNWDGSGLAGVASLWLYHKSEVDTQLIKIRES